MPQLCADSVAPASRLRSLRSLRHSASATSSGNQEREKKEKCAQTFTSGTMHTNTHQHDGKKNGKSYSFCTLLEIMTGGVYDDDP